MKKILTLTILFISLISVQAQEQLSLADAIRTGLENNYDLQIMQNKEDIAGINNTWGNTSLMPSLNLGANLRENYRLNDTENYRTQTLSPDLSLNWVIFNGFSAKINKQRFEELEAQSAGNTAILVESTIQDIILAYNNCLLQDELVSVYKELAELSEDRYQRMADSKALGTSTSYESTQAKTAMLEDQSNYLQQKLSYDNSVRTLNFLLAVEDHATWEFTSALETDTPEYALETMEEKMLSNNSNLKNQYLYQSMLAKETALAKSNYLPTVSLNTGISNTGIGQFYSGSTPDMTQNYSDAYVGMTLSWNIFNGGSTKRSIQIARINEESAQVQSSQMEHSLNNQLLQLYSNYQVQKTVLDLAMEQEASARLNLELSEEKLKNGTINSFNYRDVQIMYMNAAINKNRAVYNLIQSSTNLQRITGGIVGINE